MKVLFLSHRFSDLTIGGLAEYLHFLPEYLIKENIESIIYTQKQKNSVNDFQQILPNGIKHYAGPFLKPTLFTSRKELQRLISISTKEKIDLIHAQGTYRAGFMAMHAAKILRIPYVVTSHSDILETSSKRLQRANIKRRCKKVLANATFVTHLSPHMEEASHAVFATSHKSKIIPNGIDVESWNRFHGLSELNYMLAIGRLVPEKGFSILLDAFASYLQMGGSSSLIIAGTGPYEEILKAQVASLKLPVVTLDELNETLPKNSVIFTGYVKGELKKLLFARAKCILFATQPALFEEPFGIVQLEAMAAGKALIVSDMLSTRHLQSMGLQAVFVKPHDISNWRHAMQTILQDDHLRFSMGDANKTCVKKFDWQLIAEEYKNIYNKALSMDNL